MKTIQFLVVTLGAVQAARLSQKNGMPYDPSISSAIGLDDMVPVHSIPPPESMYNLAQSNEKSTGEIKEKA